MRTEPTMPRQPTKPTRKDMFSLLKGLQALKLLRCSEFVRIAYSVAFTVAGKAKCTET
jgi:hypothetical protein